VTIATLPSRRMRKPLRFKPLDGNNPDAPASRHAV
jgi:hypothetical protein